MTQAKRGKVDRVALAFLALTVPIAIRAEQPIIFRNGILKANGFSTSLVGPVLTNSGL